jgi:hypothetical protein
VANFRYEINMLEIRVIVRKREYMVYIYTDDMSQQVMLGWMWNGE